MSPGIISASSNMIIHYHSLADKGDVLPHLWARLREDHTPSWLWGNSPIPSLTDFVNLFSDLGRHLFLVLTPDGNEFVGILWVDEMHWGQRARAHLYFFSGHRRLRILTACREVLKHLAGPPFHLKTLLFFTDVRAKEVIRLGTLFGVTYIGYISGYYPSEYPVRVGFLTLQKGEVHGRNAWTGSDAGSEPVSTAAE